MQLLKVSTFIVLLQASFYLAAAEISTLALQGFEESTWNQLSEENGLVTSLPSTSSGRLIQEINGLQDNLHSYKNRLTQDASSSKFTFKDGIVTAVMPGGLLYAAIKKHRHQQTVDQLDQVNWQINNLSQDLTEYKAMIHSMDALYIEPDAPLITQLN